MLDTNDLKQIEIVVENAVLRGIQECPFGKDREVRLRGVEKWKQKINGEKGIRNSHRRDFIYPFLSAFLAAFLVFLIMMYWPK